MEVRGTWYLFITGVITLLIIGVTPIRSFRGVIK